jgi:hypothetical protein
MFAVDNSFSFCRFICCWVGRMTLTKSKIIVGLSIKQSNCCGACNLGIFPD